MFTRLFLFLLMAGCTLAADKNFAQECACECPPTTIAPTTTLPPPPPPPPPPTTTQPPPSPITGLNLTFETGYFSGGTYYENGKSYRMVTASNSGVGSKWGLSSPGVESEKSLWLKSPGSATAVKDVTKFNRREWGFGRLTQNKDQWYSFEVMFLEDHQNPAWYGTILNQIKASGTGYGFYYGLYLDKSTSANGEIPLGYRFMEGSGSGAVVGDVTYDSGTVRTGFSFQRNVWYNITVNYKLSQSGGSYFKTWVNGSQKINVTNRKVGKDKDLGEIRVGQYGRVERQNRHIRVDNFWIGDTKESIGQ